MLDEINKTRDPETKGVRPFAYSKNILMILLLAKVLSPINFYKEEIKQEKQLGWLKLNLAVLLDQLRLA